MSYLNNLQAIGQVVTKSAKQMIDALFSTSASTMLGLVGISLIVLIVIKLISPYLTNSSYKSSITTKAQRSHAMKQEFGLMERNKSLQKSNKNDGEATMEISQLWVYPIKALRGCQIQTATLTREGFTHDRKFMLLRDLGKEFQNITITKYPSVCLFHTSIQGKTVTVSYRPPGGIEDEVKRLEIPLEPHLQRLKKIPVNMHFSPTTAFDMGQQYNEWFSDIFGVKVVLVYWGGNPRKVLGNLPERTTNVSSKPLSLISNILGRIPIIGSILYSNDWVIAFNDCAPFLVITEESTADVTKRLPDGVEMDITKFRSNIVLKKSSSAFEEDFWAELLFGEDTTMILTGNCGRCTSLNIDYHTGKSGTGRDGQVLKLLSKDRRVDQGVKYSPIFGRYGFVSTRCEGSVLAVGDEVVVSKRNQERTRFHWPGIST